MITSVIFNNSKWYEKGISTNAFNRSNAPLEELAFFQQMIFKYLGYQMINSQGRLATNITPHHVEIKKKNDLEQVILIDTLTTSKISGIHYKLIQTRKSSEDKVGDTVISLMSPEYDIQHQIEYSFETGGFIQKINKKE